MKHPRDQWFKIYAYTPGVAAPVLVGDAPKEGEKDERRIEAQWIEPPKWGPVDGVSHVHHPDAYRPDVRLRVVHHRQALEQGFSIAACGLVHDPRLRFVETEGAPENPCPECVAATEKAIGAHLQEIHELEAKAAEKKRERDVLVLRVSDAPEADKVDP